jgi:hypothetical protein
MSRARHRSATAKRAKSGRASAYAVLLLSPPAGGQGGKDKGKGKRRSKAEGKSPAVRADKPRRGAVPARRGSTVGRTSRADGGPVNDPPKAIAAHVDAAGRVVIDYSDGTSELRDGGSLAWRDNNPGNMAFGRFTRSNGAIGRNGVVRREGDKVHLPPAIFPDTSTGDQAMRNRLTSPGWAEKTVQQAINGWAPRNDGNDPTRYGAFLSRATNVPLDATLRSLTPDQVDAIARAITREEGWKPGQSTQVSPP